MFEFETIVYICCVQRIWINDHNKIEKWREKNSKCAKTSTISDYIVKFENVVLKAIEKSLKLNRCMKRKIFVWENIIMIELKRKEVVAK